MGNFCLENGKKWNCLKNRNFSEICLGKTNFFCEIARKKSKVSWNLPGKIDFFTRIHDRPRFQTRLAPLIVPKPVCWNRPYLIWNFVFQWVRTMNYENTMHLFLLQAKKIINIQRDNGIPKLELCWIATPLCFREARTSLQCTCWYLCSKQLLNQKRRLPLLP